MQDALPNVQMCRMEVFGQLLDIKTYQAHRNCKGGSMIREKRLTKKVSIRR